MINSYQTKTVFLWQNQQVSHVYNRIFLSHLSKLLLGLLSGTLKLIWTPAIQTPVENKKLVSFFPLMFFHFLSFYFS